MLSQCRGHHKLLFHTWLNFQSVLLCFEFWAKNILRAAIFISFWWMFGFEACIYSCVCWFPAYTLVCHWFPAYSFVSLISCIYSCVSLISCIFFCVIDFLHILYALVCHWFPAYSFVSLISCILCVVDFLHILLCVIDFLHIILCHWYPWELSPRNSENIEKKTIVLNSKSGQPLTLSLCSPLFP